MKELIVQCLQCYKPVAVDLDSADLVEWSIAKGFDAVCGHCGCRFAFDVLVGVRNKQLVGKDGLAALYQQKHLS